jgi:hypothetical protein
MDRFRYITELQNEDYLRLRHNRKPKTLYHSTYGLHFFFNQGVQTKFSTWPSTTQHDSTLSGVSDAKWKEKVKAGLDATNQMNAVKRDFSVLRSGGSTYRIRLNLGSNFPYHTEVVSGIYSPNLNFVGNTHTNGPDILKAEQIAVKRLYSAIREAQTQISGPTFLGELRESVRMIRKPGLKMFHDAQNYLDVVTRAAHTARQRWRTRAKRLDYMSRAISKAWLELSFGWKPLINDVRDAAVAVSRIANDIRRKSVRGYGEDSGKTFTASRSAPFGSYIGYYITNEGRTTIKVIYRAGIDTDLLFPKSSLEAVRQLSGFKLQEFIPTLWELLPWSFLVDYFVNVGDVLAFATTDTSFVYRVHKTIVTETRWLNDCQLVSYVAPGYLISSEGDDNFGTTSVVYRTVQRAKASLPNLALTFKLPGSVNQFANMAALLLQRGKGIGPIV